MKFYNAISTISASSLSKGYRKLKAIVFGRNDPRDTYESAPFGSDCNPVKGMQAVYAPTTIDGIPVIIGYLNTKQLAAVGDNRQYSTDENGNVSFNIWQKDGKVYIGTSTNIPDYTDNAVRYAQLNTILQNYFTILNTAIAAGVTSGGGTYTPPAAPNLTPAKVEEIKIQGYADMV